ncbi:MAG: 3-phosphoserine/phosphohydroxythreonine transaminase, partial [Bacteroidales bacterium]|nr:3-phosphoserine/phosphohydroxythreonine transaminase [Bacteroidales bacterium]
VPANLLKTKAAYLQTGVWAKKAVKEAKFYGEVEVVASSEDKTYSYIPKGYTIPTDVDYFHITTNNTIYGTEIHEDMDSPVTLVADMSSDIMSRPVDVKKYGMIYGGAQKNVGPAGVTFVIVRKDLLGKVERPIQTMVDYRTHYTDEVRNRSMFNTPPVFPIFVMHETLKWVKEQGGVEAMYKINKEKAELLYNEIDRNPLFVGTAAKEDRSIMNVCFVMAPGKEALQDEFMAFAKERGMVGIKGHRSVGGFRASIYNACPKESVQALVDCMQEFEQLHK